MFTCWSRSNSWSSASAILRGTLVRLTNRKWLLVPSTVVTLWGSRVRDAYTNILMTLGTSGAVKMLELFLKFCFLASPCGTSKSFVIGGMINDLSPAPPQPTGKNRYLPHLLLTYSTLAPVTGRSIRNFFTGDLTVYTVYVVASAPWRLRPACCPGGRPS